MKKRTSFARLGLALSTVAALASAGASFVFPYAVDESESSSLRGTAGSDERLTLSLSYEIKMSQEREEVFETAPVVSFSTNNEANYNSFFTTIPNYNFNFTSGEEIGTGSYFAPKSDGSGRYRLDVTETIKKTWIFITTIYQGEAALYQSSYRDTIVYDDLDGRVDAIPLTSGSLLSPDFLSDYVSGVVGTGYTFTGLRKEDGTPFDFSAPLEGDIALTAEIVSDDFLSTSPSRLGTTISNLSGGSHSFYVSGKGDAYDIGSDPGYSAKTKTVFLAAPSGGSLAIQAGVTVNMALNDGTDGSKNSSGSQVIAVRNQSTKTLHYRLVLLDDLTIRGTLFLRSSFGQSNSNPVQSNITGAYVELDLNGHDVFIESGGKLESYGSIVDSAGTGNIYVDGGTLQTMAVVLNYKGGQATVPMALDKAFPFDSFTFPYLLCRAVVRHDGTTWGKLVAYCNIFVGTVVTAQISDFVINFIGPAGGDYFFELQAPSGQGSEVVLEGARIEGMESGLAANNVVLTQCLSQRVKTEFRNVAVAVRKFVFDIKMVIERTIDTSEFIFPIPSFFDLSFVASSVRIAQPIKMMPGSSFIADRDSLVCLGHDVTDRSAQVSVLDRSYYYVDRATGTYVSRDYAASSPLRLPPNDTSNPFQKYFGPSEVKVYGTLVFQTGNQALYRLAGAIDFNRIAVTGASSVPSSSDLVYVDYEKGSNPFLALRDDHGINVETFGFDTALASDAKHAKGYARPLVSFGTAYYTSSSLSFVGTYDSTSGVLRDSSGQAYLFDCGGSGSFEARDERSCSLLSCTYDPSTGLFAAGGSTYVYFASMYFASDGTSIQSQNALSRLGESAAFSIRYDGTRFLRA